MLGLSQAQGIILAVDFNGNGRRDYGEPVINNGHERFDDVGAAFLTSVPAQVEGHARYLTYAMVAIGTAVVIA